MLVYSLRRLMYVIPIVLGVSFLTFVLFNFMPGNPALIKAGKYATAEQVRAIEERLGLTGPWYEQYGFFLKQIVTFNFGKSFSSDQPIMDLFLEGVPYSLALAVPAFLLSIIFSVILSLLIAYYHGKLIDKVMLSICIFFMSISALALIGGAQYFLAFRWKLFPVHGYEEGLEAIRYLALPTLIWVLLTIGPSIRLYRTVFLEEVRRDYVRTAEAKGLNHSRILLKHVLKNALIPIITNEVIMVPYLIMGTFLLERFFGIPGVGDMLIKAIPSNDYPIIKAYVVLISILFVFFNLLSDILYALVDPRVRLS